MKSPSASAPTTEPAIYRLIPAIGSLRTYTFATFGKDLFAGLNCQTGFGCSRAELSQDIKQLYNTGLFESVNARVLPRRRGKFSVDFDFVEKRYPEVKTFAVEGAKVLPPAVVADVQARLAAFAGQPFTMEAMAAVKNAVEGWYHARGFGLSYISHFTGMPTGDVVAHVVEGRTAKVRARLCF